MHTLDIEDQLRLLKEDTEEVKPGFRSIALPFDVYQKLAQYCGRRMKLSIVASEYIMEGLKKESQERHIHI